MLQLKIRSAIDARERRDAALETLRKAEVLLLAGKIMPPDVERSRQQAEEAADDYENARRIIVLGNPSGLECRTSGTSLPSSPPLAHQSEVRAMRVRRQRALKDPRSRAEQGGAPARGEARATR